MEKIESARDLLELVLSEETLDNLIQTSTSLETLIYLLEVKHERIIKGKCEKINLCIDSIYDAKVDYCISARILKKSLLVAMNNDKHLEQAIKYCLDNILQCNDKVLNLLKVIFNHCKDDYKLLNFKDCDVNNLHDGLLAILKGSQKSLINYILTSVLPSYCNITANEAANLLLPKIFLLIKETKKLEYLCLCFDLFIKSELDCSFTLLAFDDFWLFLKECLTDHDQYTRKQAMRLLSKSTDIALRPHNIPHIPKYLKCANTNEIDKIWRNYLTLLDVSNEKQLHIVEPSLHMFNSVKELDFLWRDCLYEIFLNHSQNSVVYSVASFVLQNETEWQHFSKIAKVLLCAINKNEYNSDSNGIFQEIGDICDKLDNYEFEFFLRESSNVPWIPAAIWGFYSHVFKETTNFRIAVPLLENIIKNLKLIPHVFIRNGCTKLVFTYFMKNCNVDCVQNLVKFLCLLENCEGVFKERVFEYFVMNNEDKIRSFSDQLCDRFLKLSRQKFKNLQELEICLKILPLLKLQISSLITALCLETDLMHFVLDDYFTQSDVEKYLAQRIDVLNDCEDVSVLIKLCEKYHSANLSAKALNILLDDTRSYNKAQQIIAFKIASQSDIDNYSSIISIWKHRFSGTMYRNEQILCYFVEMLLKYLDKSAENVEIEQFVKIMENGLNSHTTATTILKNVSPVLKYVEQTIVLQFIEKCLNTLIILIKSNKNVKTTTNKFLSQIFRAELLDNNEFCDILFNFCEKLLEIANSFNSVAYILSEKLKNMLQQNPSKGFKFVPIIVKLILHGIIVNKNERVDYCVCQEVGLRFPSEISPNLEQVLARLWALESMLILANENSSLCDNITNKFTSLLMERYMTHFSKRYFPDSQIHLEKMRILQALLLLHENITERLKLIEFIIESFLLENHQTSVKHLMQWLLILLTKSESQTFIQRVCEKLKTIDNNRPSTVSGLIPVLYHLVVTENESQWDQVVEILLPYTMGAQFKLRIFSQVALVKIYEKAVKMNRTVFLQKYKFLYETLTQIIEATSNAPYDVSTIYHEFFDYFSLENCDCSTIFYTIPKNNGVTEIEWENLSTVSLHGFKYIKFDHSDDPTERFCLSQKKEKKTTFSENIQKKITPWKEMVDASDTTKGSDDFILVTSLIEKSANLGGLSRTCEVFGIKKMVMRTAKTTIEKEFKSLSMSSENWLDIAEVKIGELWKFILDVKKEGYQVIGAEQTSESVKLDRFSFPKRTVLILGNEKEGIPPDLIPLMDTCIEIPQFGVVRSLNVHVAGAIVIWEYCKQQKL